MSTHRDIEPGTASMAPARAVGRNVIVVIGIDRYGSWSSLTNAVSDANGARALFRRLGFEEPIPPLLDAGATGAALRALVADDLKALGPDDSLVLFYAGHGGSQTHDRGGKQIKTGYLIPADAERDRVSTWIDLEGWLRDVSLLPPRHILVILDACYSGIALDPVIKWRDIASSSSAPLEALQARCSRRVITSALDDEVALDAGPVPGHSLFTGCLIQALTGGLAGAGGVVTGSQLAVWVQHRVRTYPDARQTPDFGTFALDDRGEIAIPLLLEGGAPSLPHEQAPEVTAPLTHVPASSKPRPAGASLARPTRPTLGQALLRRLRREGDWALMVGPLIVLGIVGLASRSC